MSSSGLFLNQLLWQTSILALTMDPKCRLIQSKYLSTEQTVACLLEVKLLMATSG